jgi:hypothetical protein
MIYTVRGNCAELACSEMRDVTNSVLGTWEQGNKWTGAFLNSNTNLTEIGLALDLLWRNDARADVKDVLDG